MKFDPDDFGWCYRSPGNPSSTCRHCDHPFTFAAGGALRICPTCDTAPNVPTEEKS